MLPTYFNPEQAASNYLSDNRDEAFAAAGFYMVNYVPTPCRGISSETRKKYSQKEFRKQTILNGHYHINRFPLYSEGKNPIMRAIRYSLCSLIQLFKAIRTKDIDCIFLVSTPPIQGVLGGVLKKIKKVPFVYNLQDIFPDSLAGTG